MFFVGDDGDPLLEALPFAEEDEKVVFADLIEGLDLFKPLFHWDELCRFRVDKLADTFATKSVVVLNLLADNLSVRYDLHVVVVILILSDHVDEFVCCELLLAHHLEEGSHFTVADLDLFAMSLRSDQG